jgi:hypothetical protein
MAIATPTTITASGNAANLSVYTTAAVTLTAGRLYIIQVNGYRSSGPHVVDSVVHDAAGTPLSFTKINDGVDDAEIVGWDSSSGTRRTLSTWYVIPGSTTGSAVITITWPSSRSACGWRLVEITSGFDATGGSTTFPQVVTATGTVAAVAVTMGSFGGADSLTWLGMGWGSGTANPSETVAPTEGRTELGEHNDGERGSQGVHYENPNGSDTSIGATLSAANDWGAIGIEIAAEVAEEDNPSKVNAPRTGKRGALNAWSSLYHHR